MNIFVTTEDTFPPHLLSFDMDMDSGMILLTFNEDIEPSSVNPTGIVIQGASGVTNTSLYYQLTSARSIQVDSRTVRITMSHNDYGAIQARLSVATQLSNTYLSMDQTTLTDRATLPNAVQPISNGNALMAFNFIADSTQPDIIDFSLNLEDDTLTLTFTEPVLINSFAPDHLLLSSHRDSSLGSTIYNLTAGQVVQSTFPAESIIVVHLNDMDAFFLESNTTIASTAFNTYLTAYAGLVLDTNGNPNVASLGLSASEFVRDSSPPSVVAFDLDLNSFRLVLEFDDVVNASTFNTSAITLQSAPARRPRESFTLFGGDILSPNGRVITLNLDLYVTNGIKMNRNLCTSIENCFITVTQFVARDPSGVSTIPISDGTAIIVRNFTEDTTSPVLLFSTLNMNDGLLELGFSEPVDITSFQSGQLTLQSSEGSNSVMYSLTDSAVLTPPDSYVIISISNDDLNEIKRLTDLGTNGNNSFLSITDSAFVDINGNNVIPISSGNALQVTIFIPDYTNPQLISFSIDISSGVLTLTFSETVNTSSFDATGLTLVSGQSSTSNYTLTGGSLSSGDSPILELRLLQQDLNAINAMDNLATSLNNTYIIATSLTVSDMVRNLLSPISLVDRLQVSDLVLCDPCSNGKMN